MDTRVLLSSHIGIQSDWTQELDVLAEVLLKYGVTLRRMPDFKLKAYLGGISNRANHHGIIYLQQFSKVLTEMSAASLDPWNNKSLLWTTIKVLKLKPKIESLIELIEGEEIMEIYDLNGIQIFRNLRFLELCNYPIEMILTRPWHELYARSPSIKKQILVDCILSALSLKGFSPQAQVPNHIASEIYSEEIQPIFCQPRLRIPLYPSKSRQLWPSAILFTMLGSHVNC